MANCAELNAIYLSPYLRLALFLKGFYSRSVCRRQGTGQKPLVCLLHPAGDRGRLRIAWTADANDEGLLRFCDNISGQKKHDTIFHWLDDDARKRIAS